MKPSPLNRLETLEKIRARERRTHFRWLDRGETRAELEEWRNRLIAEGKARVEDRFVYFRWKRK